MDSGHHRPARVQMAIRSYPLRDGLPSHVFFRVWLLLLHRKIRRPADTKEQGKWTRATDPHSQCLERATAARPWPVTSHSWAST